MELIQQPARKNTPHQETDLELLRHENVSLIEQKNALETRVRKSEERRRALMHILSDLNTVNRKLTDQRKAMMNETTTCDCARRSFL